MSLAVFFGDGARNVVGVALKQFFELEHWFHALHGGRVTPFD